MPLVFAILASSFSRIEDDIMGKIIGMFFLVMTLISCVVTAAAVQNNWGTLIGSENMGNPMMYLTTWALWIGMSLIALDMLWKALNNMYPEWAGRQRIKLGLANFPKGRT